MTIALGLSKKGFRPYYVDITIVADRPRITPLKGKMRAVIADALGLPLHSVNIKAKTSEGTQLLSPRGSICAWAVSTLTPYK